jgi:uncharacterized glyoxalase superfamily protein PhnB
MLYIGSLVVVENIEKSKFFYENILEQEVKIDLGENIIFKGGFSLLSQEHFKTLIKKREISKQSNNFALYFENDSICHFVNKLKENNIELLHEIEEQHWKQRVVRFYDYDQNIIEVGESMKNVAHRLFLNGYSVTEISEMTHFPKKLINDFVTKKVEESFSKTKTDLYS